MKQPLHNNFSQFQMEALIKVAEAVNSTLNLDELFQLTLEESIAAIPTADGGVLFLYDEQQQKLICRSYVNFASEVQDIVLDPGESFTGKCFVTREPIRITSTEDMNFRTQTMKGPNQELLAKSIIEHGNKDAFRALSVPLVTDNDTCIGVITLNGFAEGGSFSEEDLRLLQVIAGQAAIAIAKARLHENLKQTNARFEQILRYQQRLLIKMNAGASLSEMLEQLSQQIKKPLLLLTMYGEHLQLGNQTEHLQTREFPIQNGRQFLGKLFVYLEEPFELSETDAYFIQQSILFFTLEINQQATIREVEDRFRSELVEDLLNGMLTESFIKRAEGLGLNTADQFLPIAAEAGTPSNDDIITDFIWKRELAHLLQMEVSHRFPGSLVIQRQQHFIILLSVREESMKEQLDKVKRIAAETQRFVNQQQSGAAIRFGLGRTVSHIEELPDSIEDAVKVLQYMRSANIHGTVMDSSSLGFERLLIPNKEKDIEAFIHSTLGPIIKHDREKQTELLKTLTVYTQFLQRPGQAAKELHIHLNTLHYRLKKIAELLGADLQNTDVLLNVQLACKLLRPPSNIPL